MWVWTKKAEGLETSAKAGSPAPYSEYLEKQGYIKKV